MSLTPGTPTHAEPASKQCGRDIGGRKCDALGSRLACASSSCCGCAAFAFRFMQMSGAWAIIHRSACVFVQSHRIFHSTSIVGRPIIKGLVREPRRAPGRQNFCSVDCILLEVMKFGIFTMNVFISCRVDQKAPSDE